MSSEGKKDKWRRQKRRRGKRQKDGEKEETKEKRKRSLSFFSALFCSLFLGFSYYYFCFLATKNNAKIAFAVAFCLPIVAAVVVALAGGVGEARE